MEELQLLTSENVDMALKPTFGECLYFQFKGKLTENGGLLAINAWNQEFESSDKKYDVIWDCIDMEGFEMSARKDWSQSLTQSAHRINRVFLISDSIIIRGAARLMLKLFPIELVLIKSRSALSSALRASKDTGSNTKPIKFYSGLKPQNLSTIVHGVGN